jgi:anti-sigma regulatory factor (Ser/Thr protein kinase)
LDEQTREYPLESRLTEEHVWKWVRELVPSHASSEGQELLAYGVSEMVNNAIDHSEGKKVVAHFWRTPVSVTVRIADDGIGIFQKISNRLHLTDPRQSLLELGKGKFTTDPQRHTGEGVFFTSRAFDRFSLRSSDLLFTRSALSEDWLVEIEEKTYTGTRVAFSLLLPPKRALAEVFARYSSGPDDHRFAKTHVPLKLATFGDESLLSRSSARRVLARVERFDEALLDFRSVKSIGPAFADEIFRVFANQHPEVTLISINANEPVTLMIRRAKAAQAEGESGLFDGAGGNS